MCPSLTICLNATLTLILTLVLQLCNQWYSSPFNPVKCNALYSTALQYSCSAHSFSAVQLQFNRVQCSAVRQNFDLWDVV